MSLPDALVALAFAASLLGLAVEARALRSRRSAPFWGLAFALASAALAAGAFLYLLSRFIVGDLSYENVFLYTRTDLDLRWRIAGSWTGMEGSLLLWAAALAVVAAALAWRHRSLAGDDAEERARSWTRLFLLAILAAFLGAAWRQGTFDSTPAFFLEGRPLGNGLNPTLRSPFILIHPPLMFVAYALATVPAAAALGHLASGTDRWSWVSLTWARLDWLLYTFAIGLGGMWAYYTLGFGGYWAWDPVEVANLLPWLALTLYLHAQLHHRKYGDYRNVGPFLGLLPFLLTVFSTLSTRSGLWVSVHAFTDPTNSFTPDAAMRALRILDAQPGLSFYLGLFVATFVAGLGLWAWRLSSENAILRRWGAAVAVLFLAFAGYAAAAPASALSAVFAAADGASGGRVGLGLLGVVFAAGVSAAAPALLAPDAGTRRSLRVDLRSLAFYSILVIGISLLVFFLFHMSAVDGWDTRFYVARIPWVAAPAALGLLVLQGHGIYGRRRSLWLAGGALAAAILAAILWPAERGGAFLLVLSAALLVVSLDRVRRVGAPPKAPRSVLRADTLLWLAALLDVAFWLNPPSRIGLGVWSLHVAWPIQVPMGAIALYVLWQSHRILAGAAPRRPDHIHLLAGLLGAYFVAPLLAATAWLLRRRTLGPAPLDAKAKARLRQVALYGLHLAVALALVGYAASTHFQSEATVDIPLGATVAAAGTQLAFEGARLDSEPGTPFAAAIEPRFSTPDGKVAGHLGWEDQVGAHFPLPATLRTWDRDLYVQVESVTLAPGACPESGGTVEAYQASGRVCLTDTVESVRLTAKTLPGISLVWAALALFVSYMALLLAMDRPRHGAAPEATELLEAPHG